MEHITKILKEHRILLPNGDPDITLINQISSGVITPFFQLAWERLNDPLKTLLRLNQTLKALIKRKKTEEAFNVLRTAFDSLKIEFSETLNLFCFHTSAREALLLEITADMEELLQEMS